MNKTVLKTRRKKGMMITKETGKGKRTKRRKRKKTIKKKGK